MERCVYLHQFTFVENTPIKTQLYINILLNITLLISNNKKLELDAEKLNFEGQKLAQKDNMDKEKLQSQEDQADLRAEVTLAGQRGRSVS